MTELVMKRFHTISETQNELISCIKTIDQRLNSLHKSVTEHQLPKPSVETVPAKVSEVVVQNNDRPAPVSPAVAPSPSNASPSNELALDDDDEDDDNEEEEIKVDTAQLEDKADEKKDEKKDVEKKKKTVAGNMMAKLLLTT